MQLPSARTRLLVAISALVVGLIAGGAYAYLRPVPEAHITSLLPTSLPAQGYDVPLPGLGSSAIAVGGLGVVEGRHVDTPISTASIAKVMLALCVLEKAPLRRGDSGPSYTIDRRAVADYTEAASFNGSTLPVVEGERLTEYQALQALMIPSADNIADSLARWTFGGHRQFKAYAQGWLRAHHLSHTVIGDDASGLDVDTRSTARDLAQLGLIALRSSVLREIMAQRSVTFPGVGYRANYNSVLGQGGITGGKTGNNRANRGAFLFTSRIPLAGRMVDVSAVILGQPDLATALAAAPPMMSAIRRNVGMVMVATSGEVVGASLAPWGPTSPVVVAQDLRVLRWLPIPVRLTLSDSVLAASVRGAVSRVPVATAAQRGPTFWWRLTRR